MATSVIIAVVITLLVTALAVTGWRLRSAFSLVEVETHSNQAAKETIGKLRELAGRVAQQVDEHSHKVEEISDELASLEQPGEEDVLLSVNKLIDANFNMKQQLQAAEDRLQAQARQIESHAVEARTDPLTQVANRRALEDQLRQGVNDFQQRGRPFSLMIIDVDFFKKFNDSHGHQAGDEILRGVARILRQSVAEHHLVARYGGEEFAIVFCGASFGTARDLAETSRQAISAARFRFEGRELRVTASAGLAELAIGEDQASLIKRADEALYASKHAGRNCCHFNDGFANHPIKLDSHRPSPSPAKTGKPVVGDEWLFEPAVEEVVIADPAAAVSSKPEFFDALIERLSMLKRLPKTKLSLMLAQVDGLERIRNEHGDSAASIVTRVAAQVFKAHLRDLDQVSRLEENTFCLLLPGTQASDAMQIAQRVLIGLSRYPLPKRAGVARISLALGVAEASNADDLQAVLRRARKALDTAVVTPGQRIYGLNGQDLPLKFSHGGDD
jgi:diguanylate cyclase